ncbi:hypothetical protein FP2506_10346 [Fulvimarina pelagi HTCC2506]|uniref:Uncharacterized protein n=1 Tax=Fulvimarina pelagi HTCC2506 TaxID=314231 RepID=Q0G527_9HYPH|nr:hypothetical protein FP2506_10346 [Fulvimarina pelagi HTCC2506]
MGARVPLQPSSATDELAELRIVTGIIYEKRKILFFEDLEEALP